MVEPQTGISHKEITPRKTYPNLRFEPAIHIGGNADPENPFEVPQEWSDTYSSYAQGDPDAHAWGKEGVSRIEETHPKIITIDGLGSGYTIESNNSLAKDIPPGSHGIWWLLPARPEKIRPQEKSVLVVAGDDYAFGSAFNAPLLTHPQGKDFQAIRDALANQENIDFNRSDKDITAETTAILSAAILIDVALGGAIGTDIVRNIKREPRGFTRRRILQYITAIGAGTAVTGAASVYKDQRINSQDQASKATTETDKEHWLDIVEITEPRLIKAKQVNMRTALEILKTKDAIDELGLPEETAAAVLMGGGHSFDARDFLESDEKAQQAIREYFDSIDPILRKALADHPVMSYTEAKARIVDHLAQTYVMKVDEPDHRTFNTPNFNKAVEDATSVAADFKSKRVLAAFN